MDEDEKPKKGKKPPILLAVAVASVLGSVVFSMVFSGVILGKNPENHEEAVEKEAVEVADLPPLEFLELEPLLISLGAAAAGQQLRFEGYLEVNPNNSEEVVSLMPRIMDVLNTYLRAVDFSDIEEPSSLLKLRLQMLRRVQIVVGEGRVNDLLVSKFLIS